VGSKCFSFFVSANDARLPAIQNSIRKIQIHIGTKINFSGTNLFLWKCAHGLYCCSPSSGVRWCCYWVPSSSIAHGMYCCSLSSIGHWGVGITQSLLLPGKDNATTLWISSEKGGHVEQIEIRWPCSLLEQTERAPPRHPLATSRGLAPLLPAAL
jgi:hypothetical protein